ncbi:hypothetical protein [Nocardia sp. NBC_01329]|nr:hypothetical protein OG405_16340 [Nocardia sp. NBC_01329]
MHRTLRAVATCAAALTLTLTATAFGADQVGQVGVATSMVGG